MDGTGDRYQTDPALAGCKGVPTRRSLGYVWFDLFAARGHYNRSPEGGGRVVSR